LPIFALKESDYDPNNETLENNNNGLMFKRGSKLISEPNLVNQNAVTFGTLGFIITLDTGFERKHAVATVGHVLGDTGNSLYFDNNGTLLKVQTNY
jgi:hypothetical protein